MDHLPASWTALCGLALLLGAKHGLDADHLATVDGLTRYNASRNPVLARRAGALFSLGHGAIVVAVALLASTLARGFAPPAWLEATGVTISIVFLFGLAALNVRAVLIAAPHAVVAPAGIKGRVLRRLLAADRAWMIAGVGMLFALSFDTLSQAALFALAADRFGGPADVLAVASLFVLGMLVVDGMNGLWISRLIRRADRVAAVASRVMALAVATISFAIGCLTLAKVALPAVATWTDAHELAAGTSVLAAVLASFLGAVAVARFRRAGTQLAT